MKVLQLSVPGNITKTGSDSGAAYTFRLTDVPQYTNFTALFDMYRIDAVEVEFLISQMGANMLYPTLYWTPDYDDATAPANANTILEFQTAEVYQFTEAKTAFRRLVQPRVANTVYNGIVASGYSTLPVNTFINSDTPGVAYYGMKYWLVGYNSTTANQSNIQIVLRYHLSFKYIK
jgi:hypothetical protein